MICRNTNAPRATNMISSGTQSPSAKIAWWKNPSTPPVLRSQSPENSANRKTACTAMNRPACNVKKPARTYGVTGSSTPLTVSLPADCGRRGRDPHDGPERDDDRSPSSTASAAGRRPSPTSSDAVQGEQVGDQQRSGGRPQHPARGHRSLGQGVGVGRAIVHESASGRCGN